MHADSSAPDAIVERRLEAYQTHRGLPPLVGLGTFTEAGRPGLSVEESVRRLKCHHYVLKRLHQIFIARLTSEPVYELKMAYSYHAHLCAEQVAALRGRVGEMREPPLGLEKVPHLALERLFDELLATPSTPALLLGLYEVALPALREALHRQNFLEPVLGGAVFGENDHPLVGPLFGRPDVFIEPADQTSDLGVELGGRPFRPRLHLLEER